MAFVVSEGGGVGGSVCGGLVVLMLWCGCGGDDVAGRCAVVVVVGVVVV